MVVSSILWFGLQVIPRKSKLAMVMRTLAEAEYECPIVF